MWNVKTKIIPVKIGAAGIVSPIQKTPEQHPWKAGNQGTQKKTQWALRNASETTNVKYKTLNTRNDMTCAINCNCRVAAKLYRPTLNTWFVSGM